MMWQYGDGTGWWMLLWGGLMMLLFWGGIIGLIAWAIHSFAGQSAGADARDRPLAPRTPLDIARERYARGEIGQDEFAQIRRELAAP